MKLSDWPVSTSAFTQVKFVEVEYCVGSNEMYSDENIDPYSSRNVTGRTMRGAFHGSVPFAELPHGTDRSRSFRPIDRGYGRVSRDSSGSRDSSLGPSHVVRPELRVVLPWLILTGLAIS